MRTRVSIKGHPIHTILIAAPVGGFAFVLALDLLYLMGAGEIWWDATVPVLILALAGGIVASIPGAIDLYTSVKEDETLTIGISHGILAFVLLAVGAVNLTIRTGVAAGEANWAVWWSVGTFALLAIVGALGGHLVYNRGVGVEGAEEPRKSESDRPDRRSRAQELGSPI